MATIEPTQKLYVRGFTLIEMMITVAIVAILAAIAYPSYVEQIQKGRRAECRSGLLRTMQQQERSFTQYNTYVSFASGTTTATIQAYSGDSPGGSACNIAAAACSGSTLSACVELTATPTRADTQVSLLFFDSNGQKRCTLAGTSTKVTDNKVCWP